MGKQPFGLVLRHLRRVARPADAAEPGDGELLERFIGRREEAAFDALLRRHGNMVWNVCGRLLPDSNDAEDAFQATFLVLVRKADSISRRDSVAGWLHGVAQRVALRARLSGRRRQTLSEGGADVPAVEPAADRDWWSLREVLDEELGRLPEKYRAPLVLCYLEGKTNDEAARQLGWTRGTIAGRLSRARDVLRGRLARRGLALGSVALGTMLAERGMAGTLPAALGSSTLQAVLQPAASRSAAAVLAEGVVQTMRVSKLKIGALVLLVAGVLAGGAAVLGSHSDNEPAALVPGVAVALAPLPENPPVEEPDKEWGTIKGRIVFPKDVMVPPQQVFNIQKDRAHCTSNGPIVSEEWVIDKESSGLRWVVVSLAPEPGQDAKPLPVHPSLREIKVKEAVMDQPCCKFLPHVLAMREGQTLVVKNSSPVSHNFNYQGHPLRNRGQNILIPAGGSHTDATLKADARLPMLATCNIHPWMKGYIWVFDHPYFTVTDEKGNFVIRHAPAGEWRLKVWHDNGWRNGAAGRDGEKVTIKGGVVTDLEKLDVKPN